MVELEEPDKGRAWLIAIAGCIINTILSGLTRMVGILYVSIIDTYGVSREEATQPFTIRYAIRCLAGPLVGIVGQRYSIRAVTFWGGVLASAGVALCTIAPNMTWMTIFWGVIHGIGFAFANTLFQVVLNQYFQKYRATASGIALSGACVGSLVFPYMTEVILDNFGLSGGFLIMGGIVMHVMPTSLLLTSPQWVEHPEAYARLYALKKSGLVAEGCTSSDLANELETSEQEKVMDRKMARSASLSNSPIESADVYNFSRQNLQREKDSGVFTGVDFLSTNRTNRRESPVVVKKSRLKSFNGSSNTSRIQTLLQTFDQIQQGTKKPAERETEQQQSSDSKPDHSETLKQTLKSIVYLYLNPMYVLISMCMTSYMFIFLPILTVLVDYSRDKGIPESYGKYLINTMAIAELAGRLCFGWVTDRKVLPIPKFLILLLCLQGLFIVLFPLAMTLGSFVAVLVFYSITAGALIVIFPVLVLEYVDNSSQSVGMACIGFLSGVASFAKAPAIGYFRDYVGSYDGLWYITGGISIICGVLWMFEPIVISRCHIRRFSETELDNLNPEQSELEDKTKSS